jgi:hypothetical protein
MTLQIPIFNSGEKIMKKRLQGFVAGALSMLLLTGTFAGIFLLSYTMHEMSKV